MAMVGHKTEAIYRRYAIVSATDLTRAAQQLDAAAGIVPGIVRAATASAQSPKTRFPEKNVVDGAGLEFAVLGLIKKPQADEDLSAKRCGRLPSVQHAAHANEDTASAMGSTLFTCH
jgi:hypothetical protein